MTQERIGGPLAARPLHFFWIADCSGAMAAQGKIQALNNAIREAIPHVREVAKENPNGQIFMRALRFSDGAQWHVPNPMPVEQFTWPDLQAGGVTDLGAAFALLAEALKMPPMPQRALPPVLALLSDGQPTDDYRGGLGQLMAQPWAKKAVRIAIAIGEDADRDPLQEFIAHPEYHPLQANNPEQLARLIRWVSAEVSKSASAPASQILGKERSATNVPLPEPPPLDDAGIDVW